MNENIDIVKRRIKKLLALSKSPNENEAASALKKANEMMADYNFTAVQFSEYTEAKMYKYLVKTIDRMAKQNIRKNAKYKYRQSYRAGIASRLYDRMYELGQQCSWRNPKELKAQKKQIAEFVEKQVAIETSKKKFEKANPTAFSKGNNDADGINLSRQMTGSGTRRIGYFNG